MKVPQCDLCHHCATAECACRLHDMPEGSNYEKFRECISESIIERSTTEPTKRLKRKGPKGRRRSKQDPDQDLPVKDLASNNDPEDLADFIDVPNHLESYGVHAEDC